MSTEDLTMQYLYSAILPYLEHHKSTGQLVRSVCNVLVLLTGYREGFSDGFLCVAVCETGQVLLTNLLVNTKNVDPHRLCHHRWNISSWLAAQSVRIFTFGAYKLLMKQMMMMSLSIEYLEGYFSGYPFQLYCNGTSLLQTFGTQNFRPLFVVV